MYKLTIYQVIWFLNVNLWQSNNLIHWFITPAPFNPTICTKTDLTFVW